MARATEADPATRMPPKIEEVGGRRGHHGELRVLEKKNSSG